MVNETLRAQQLRRIFSKELGESFSAAKKTGGTIGLLWSLVLRICKSFFRIRNVVFNRFFKLKHCVSVSPCSEQLNRECSLFTDNGRFLTASCNKIMSQFSSLFQVCHSWLCCFRT